MSDKTAVLTQLKQILVEDLDLHLKVEEIEDDAVLLEGGLGLDSVVLVELISFLETRFGIQLDDQSLDAESFENLSALADMVLRARAPVA